MTPQTEARYDAEDRLRRSRAEASLVFADDYEERGQLKQSRTHSNYAGREYDAIGWNWFGRVLLPHGLPSAWGYRLAAEHWELAKRCYRRGLSHARASSASMRAAMAWDRSARLMVPLQNDPRFFLQTPEWDDEPELVPIIRRHPPV